MGSAVTKDASSSRSQLVRESATGSLGSFFALGAGLLLDLTLAFLLGAGSETDALFVALRIPLGVAVFFPPTAIQVLVPVISRWLDQKDKRATDVQTSAVVVATFLLSGGVALAGILAAPLLTRMIAPGLGADAHQLATGLARVVFLIIPPIATSEVLRAYRHAHRAHGLASALQGVLGLTIVAILLLFSRQISVEVAAWAYVAGAFGQLIGAWVIARASGFQFLLGSILTPEIRTIGNLATRPLGASAIQLATRVVEQMIASFLAPGSITILTYANRLVSAVGGTLFFRPIMTAFLGPMTLSHIGGNSQRTRELLRDGLRTMLMISAALFAVVAVAGTPFVTGLFGLGSFDPSQARILGIVVAVYAASLPGAGLQRMLLGFSFARLDTSTYLRNTSYGAVANLGVLAVMLLTWRPPLAILMIPIAYGIAQTVNVWHAAVAVRRQLGPPFAGLERVVAKVAIVVLAASIVMVVVRTWLSPAPAGPPLILVGVGLATAAAGAISLAAGWLLAAPAEARRLLAKLRQSTA